MKCYPTELPNVLILSYDYTPYNEYAEVEKGLPIIKRLFKGGVYSYEVKTTLKSNQVGIFEQFYQDVLLNGTESFLINLPIGNNFVEKECLIYGGYKINIVNNMIYSISMNLINELN